MLEFVELEVGLVGQFVYCIECYQLFEQLVCCVVVGVGFGLGWQCIFGEQLGQGGIGIFVVQFWCGVVQLVGVVGQVCMQVQGGYGFFVSGVGVGCKSGCVL